MTSWKPYVAAAAVVVAVPGAGYATEYLSVQEAQHLCFPTAASFEPAHIIYTEDQIRRIEAATGEKIHTKGLQMWKAVSGGELLGYFIVDYVVGKHLVIDYAVALTPDERIKDVEVLQYRESYGGEIRNSDWLKQFVGKNSESKLMLNDDIINIGGATLSSRHVTEGIKRVLITVRIAHG